MGESNRGEWETDHSEDDDDEGMVATALREAEAIVSSFPAPTGSASAAGSASPSGGAGAGIALPSHVTAQHVLAIVNKYLDIQDQEALDVILAVAVGINDPGDQTWAHVVAPPGGGKSEVIRAFSGGRVVSLSTLTPQTFISGLKGAGPDRDRDLLPHLYGKLLIVKDFGSILSLPPDQQRRIFADLREIYDGELTKAFGSGVGRKSYPTQLGVLTGATDAIDRYRMLNAQLGERFLRINMKGDDEKAVTRALEKQGGEEAMRQEMKAIFQVWLDRSKEWFDSQVLIEQRHLEALKALAIIAARLRSPVQRDHSHVVIGTPHTEIGTRLVKELKRLMVGLANVRGTMCATHADYFTTKRVALDTVPQYRLDIVDALLGAEILKPGQGLTRKAVSVLTGTPFRTVTERLEDMWVLKLLRRGGTADFSWRLTTDNLDLLERASIDASPEMIHQIRKLSQQMQLFVP